MGRRRLTNSDIVEALHLVVVFARLNESFRSRESRIILQERCHCIHAPRIVGSAAQAVELESNLLQVACDYTTMSPRHCEQEKEKWLQKSHVLRSVLNYLTKS